MRQVVERLNWPPSAEASAQANNISGDSPNPKPSHDKRK